MNYIKSINEYNNELSYWELDVEEYYVTEYNFEHDENRKYIGNTSLSKLVAFTEEELKILKEYISKNCPSPFGNLVTLYGDQRVRTSQNRCVVGIYYLNIFIKIKKYKDEWFLVDVKETDNSGNNDHKESFYKCDQFSGLQDMIADFFKGYLN